VGTRYGPMRREPRIDSLQTVARQTYQIPDHPRCR
jgi:hypothetical protein